MCGQYIECNSRLQNKTIRFSVFSKCLEASTLTLPPQKHCPSLCDTGTMSPQCIFAFSSCWICASTPHLLVQEPQGTRSRPSWGRHHRSPVLVAHLLPDFLVRKIVSARQPHNLSPNPWHRGYRPPLSTCSENTFNICCVTGESLWNPVGL